jgi:heme-degrading monooxygenase HmoA
MIARIWHGVTAAAKADEYMEYLQHTGIPDYRATTGNLGVYVLRRIEEDRADFQLISLWESFAAVKAFAGSEPENARYYPKDREFLLEMEETVSHHEVLVGMTEEKR